MDAEKIAEKARKSISKFCMEECKSYCCRKGYLVLASSEVDAVTQNTAEKLKENGILAKISKNKYSLYLGNYDNPCPSLREFKCIIHRSKNRPLACRQFPIFVEGETVKFSNRCLAVKQGLFYPYIKKLKAMNYKIIESDPFYDSGFLYKDIIKI